MLSENKVKYFTNKVVMCLALIKSFHEVNIGINFLSMAKSYLLKHLQSDRNDGQCDALLDILF